MSKIYLGIIISLITGLGLLSWRYSAAQQDIGELEQANRQLLTSLQAVEQQNKTLHEQQQSAAEISARHHEKTLSIVRAEQQAQAELLQHKITRLQNRLRQVADTKTVSMEEKNETIQQQECAETIIPEFYLKQL